MAENEIPLNLSVESKDAEKSLDKFQKNAEDSVSGIEKAFNGLKIVAAAAVAIFAGKALVDGISRAVDAASEADQAVAKLNFALAANNDYTAEASLALQDYAKTVQETTTVSDDLAVEALALALSFGQSTEGAKKLVTAAIDLSAVTGRDLLTSVTDLGKSTQGVVPRIDQLRGAMEGLTQAQKDAGGVIDLVLERFGGASVSLTKTFAGAIEQASNNFGDIFESAGKVITRNAVVVDGINVLSKAFATLATAIEHNTLGLSTLLSTALQSIISIIVKTIDVINGLVYAVSRFDFDALAIAIGAATVAFVAFFAVQNFGAIVATANSLLFLSGILYSVAAASISATAALIPLALPFVAIGAAITYGLYLIDQLVASILDTVSIASRLSSSFSNFFSDFSKGSERATSDADKTTISFEDQLAALAKISPALQRVQTEYKNSGKSAKESLGVAQEILQKIATATQEVIDKNIALRASIDGINSGEVGKIQAAVNGEKEKLKIKTEQLKKDGLLSAELSEQLKIQGKLLDEKAFKEIAKIQLDAVKELQKENGALAGQINSAYGGQFDQIKANLDLALAVVDQKQQELEINGKLTEAALEELNIRREMLGLQAAQAKDKIGKKDLVSQGNIDALQAAFGSTDFFKNLNDSTGEVLGAADAIMGTITGVIGVVQGLIDFIPKVLEGLTNIFNSLAELPLKILSGVKDLFKSVLNVITNLIPNLATAIEGILIAAIEFVAEKLPDALISLIKALPDIIIRLLDRLPDLVIKFVSGLAEAMPEIAVALVDALITKGGLVRIGFAILKAFYIELPIAIAKGIFKGFEALGPTIGKLFGENIQAVFDGIGIRIVAGIKAGVSQLIGLFTKGLTAYFVTLPQLLLSAFKQIPDLILSAFEQIPDLLSDAFSSLPNQISDGLGKALDKLNPANLLAKMFSGGNAKPGKVEGILGINIPFVTFAQGGLVPGQAKVPGDSVANDRIIALLSPGEAVLPRSITTNPALKPYVDALLTGDEKMLPNFGIFGGGGGVNVKIPNLGDAISGAGNFVSGGFESLAAGGDNVLAGISSGAQKAIDLSQKAGQKALDELKKLNPENLWEIAKRKAYEGIAKMLKSSGARLAEGGLVPSGYPNDTFPARLTSGEMVLPSDSVKKLDNFMSNNESNANSRDNEILISLLAKIASIVSQPVTVETTATVNSKAFADIILSLNRNNARLSA